jgi:hypothetical protein
VEAADPEEGLALAAHVAEFPVQLSGALEQGQLPQIRLGCGRVLVAVQQETGEDGSLIQQPGLPDPLIHVAASWIQAYPSIAPGRKTGRSRDPSSCTIFRLVSRNRNK